MAPWINWPSWRFYGTMFVVVFVANLLHRWLGPSSAWIVVPGLFTGLLAWARFYAHRPLTKRWVITTGLICVVIGGVLRW